MRDKLTVVGAGIIGTFEAWYALLWAEQQKEDLIVRMVDQNAYNKSTSKSIVPSITATEMLAVVPPGPELLKKLDIPFNQPGGIKISDVKGIMDESAIAFIRAVQEYSNDVDGHQARIDALLTLGKKGMEFWEKFYDSADDELKAILEKSNFQPCREPRRPNPILGDGYRIDIIEKSDAETAAQEIIDEHVHLGYKNCKRLSPAEVAGRDPLLADFCNQNSINGAWKPGVSAVWRPGGCINTGVFMPLFHAYMQKRFGTLTNEDGKIKPRFAIKYGRKVEALEFNANGDEVNGLKFADTPNIKRDKYSYRHKNYVFCTGEAVGTMTKLRLDEPPYAGFAGAVLFLHLPIPADQLEGFRGRKQGMEVHQEGVVLAWQASHQQIDGKDTLVLGMGGTKGFYGPVEPTAKDEFLRDRNLVQLNAANLKFYRSISLALGKDTQGKTLTADDLKLLIEKGYANPWIGRRAIGAAGFPSFGPASRNGKPINNVSMNINWSSGGVSSAHIAAYINHLARSNRTDIDPKLQEAIKWGNPRLQPPRSKL